MKNGIAMISNLSMPVKSFSATDSIGTWVMVNTKVNTVRPNAMEIGMPVSMSAISKPKRITELISQPFLVGVAGWRLSSTSSFEGRMSSSVIFARPST